jgi:hypothetical protein
MQQPETYLTQHIPWLSWLPLPAATPPLRDWPEYMQPYPQPVNIFSSVGLGSGFYLNGWNTYVVPLAQTRTAGIHGEPALCAKISNNVGVGVLFGAGLTTTVLPYIMVAAALCVQGLAPSCGCLHCPPKHIYLSSGLAEERVDNSC